MLGNVDYTLAKRSMVAAFRKGLLGPPDVCDAHPELLRAARNIGVELSELCPICASSPLRLVRYVFGDELRAVSGRVVYPETMVSELARRFEEFRCYSVEVCTQCHWNHLLSCSLAGRKYAAETEPARGHAVRARRR